MCRIAGILSRNNLISDTTYGQLMACSPLLSLGGPDAEGLQRNEKSAFLHRRLSIIDTSAGANQPFISEDGRYQLVFNGEIFNYSILYSTYLKTKGVTLKTSSDTEVLFHLLINYGSECLPWLSGFFAFCFYDTQEHTALLGRDRFGKKPLLYFHDEEQFLFASEMKAILQFDISREIDPEALQLYFQLKYVPPTHTIFKQIHKLGAGQYLEFGKGGIEVKTYYNAEIRPAEYKKLSYQAACKELVGHFRRSVQERMISDVPLGAFLSGGIDSSTVVAMAAEQTAHLNTFSIGYKNKPQFDETKYAQLVAKKYKTNHEVFYLTEDDYKQELFNILDYIDEPFADSSVIPQYILCKKTRKKVTVALSGDGGDEIFAGYNKHKAEWIYRNNKVKSALVSAGGALWENIPKSRNTKIGEKLRQLNKFAKGAKLTQRERYFQWCSQMSEMEANELFSEQWKAKINSQKITTITNELTGDIRTDDFNEFLLNDLNLLLPGDMLHKVDMMSMANSLEVRSPFLDYRLVDFAFTLPEEYKINKNLKKRIVQDAFRDYLPEELYNRPKQGFDIPLLEWFREDLYTYIFDELLAKNKIEEQGIFNFDTIEKLRLKLLSNNPENVQTIIWSLIVFQYWWNKYCI